ncbi:putative hydrolase of the HAD superfamily [Sphaerotilus hippei]|uniref:Putative hydrolase of the HAD superfamily n=1 Tax=Sphaerotilus hippei TaxID=744406 RepID=A0A318H1Q9_9BURK|nr:pyrimidine 5'-nucleotidase [Sphaerotilus hippei]PXW96962.1 putative hydrolase of the HAD superfamily [Sphaerotilus hippei]
MGSPGGSRRDVAPARGRARRAPPVWLFDLDNTLHNASRSAFGPINQAMTDYIERELAVDRSEADRLRGHYWQRYGATLLGLMRHHGVAARHFLHHTHVLPGLEAALQAHPHDVAVLARLPGRKFVLTNAPRAYAERVLQALGLARAFDGVIAIEQMRMFGHLRPKPDARMLRQLVARLRVPASRCVLVEDTLEHQKAARRVGMRTVWMQRWVRRQSFGPEAGARLHRRPVYVCDRIRSLRMLDRYGSAPS